MIFIDIPLSLQNPLKFIESTKDFALLKSLFQNNQTLKIQQEKTKLI